jgi:hypothetical protein
MLQRRQLPRPERRHLHGHELLVLQRRQLTSNVGEPAAFTPVVTGLARLATITDSHH